MDAPRLLEVMPTFNKEEKRRFLQLTSLNFNEFINYPPEKFSVMPIVDRSALFKGRRVLESCLERIQRLGTSNLQYKTLYFKTMSKWGHIALLAQDWVAAVSSYQEAYKCNPDEFWKEPGCYFGLGLCYLHFKDFKLAADAFQRVLYSFPTLECIAEVKARLGLCHQNMSNYDQALKYYNQAMADLKESNMLPKIHIRFNIALTKENSGQLTHAEMEYKHILNDLMELVNSRQSGQYSQEQIKLYAALNRQLGWVSYRQQSSMAHHLTAEERSRRLGDAENFLKQAQHIEPLNGRTYYFFGRCYGELPTKAHDAFINYRHSIDKSEADADTWCSIGWLYQQQNQPIDALQAFVCAVELDAQHSAAWTDLGQLYEINHQFEDALNCYKQAVKFNPVAPEALKARISVLEKELNTSNQFLAQRNTPQPQRKLTSLKDAWHLPIPSELRQRQDEFLKVKQQRYRDGSPLWRMGDLAAPLIGVQEIPGLPPMDTQQVQMMRLLQMNRDRLNSNERQLLREMEQRDRECQEACYDSFYPQNVHIASKLPTFTEEDFQALKGGNHIKTEVKLEPEEESNEADSKNSEKNLNDRVVQDGQVTSTTDLPTTFCLDSKLHVPLDISSTELLDLCTKRVERISDFKPVFDETAAPPRPPTPPPREDVKPQSGQNPLLKPTPLVVVESRKDAQSPELQRFVESTPIALIRGLTAVLKMDLSLFSTKTLRDTAPETEVEVRTQYKMPCDLNVDHLGVPSWECTSTRSFTTVNKYSLYQADSFQHSLKEEAEKLRTAGAKYAQQIAEADAKKRRRGPNGEEWAMPMKSIKFGTNVDLSDETKWKPQLQELSKMPPFCRLIAGCNMLSHLGHTVLGMNTVQLYMKVPGSRTPAHQENNCFASININIGPGDCEWFGVPNEYWGQVNTMCKKRNIDFLKGSYWPNVEDLLDEGIPVYRFTQKAGDLVYVGGGCVHWVQATGWCNNIAWNVGPITYQQLSLSVNSYEWNKLQGYKSLVPMQHLCWQLAKNVRFTNQKVFTLVRGVLIRSLAFCKMVSDWALAQGKQLKSQPRQKNEITHYCTLCEIEVFNVLFVKEKEGKFPVYCVYCTRRSGLTKDYIILQQIPLNDLKKIFDEMQMNHIPKAVLVC